MDCTGKSKEKKVLQKLRCSVQNYDWGKKGDSSYVARLCSLNSASRIQPDCPYAELWMGTHESGPSYIDFRNGIGSGLDCCNETLKQWIQKNPHVLGSKIIGKWGFDLPFLFKVLSVAKPLSIQAHPDKQLAKKLHKLQPELYKDDNHKPEMALAITEFEALCGFTTLAELKDVLQSVPEVLHLIGDGDSHQVLLLEEEDEDKSIIKSAFTHLMTASKSRIDEALSRLKERLTSESKIRPLTEKENLVLRLEKQYPGDVGVISAFFFNYVKLNPGEALYLGANEPHAYLNGDCIECMATSDNVVRAGLSSKHRDVQTLCSMLTYKQGFPKILKGFPLNTFVTRYLPPFDEFEVDRCILPCGASTVFPAVPGPSIFLIISGKGKMDSENTVYNVVEGDVVFGSCNMEIRICADSELHLYRAGVNSRVIQLL